MENILKEAVEAAKKKNVSTLVVASTSGKTADSLFELAKGEKLNIIVVTHDEGKPAEERRFNEDIRRKLLANNITVYTHNQSLLYHHADVDRGKGVKGCQGSGNCR